MAWITATEVRERTPKIGTGVTGASDSDIAKIITRAEADIIANSGRYVDLLQGHCFGERVNLNPIATVGVKRLEAKGGETKGTLALKPVVSSSYYIFKNPDDVDFKHIRGDETSLLVEGIDYSFNTSTGVITFLTALSDSDRIYATYDFTMDTTNRAPRVIIELAKTLSAFYLLEVIYGANAPSNASELVNSFKISLDNLRKMSKNQFLIPEFDNVIFDTDSDWSNQEITSSVIRRQ